MSLCNVNTTEKTFYFRYFWFFILFLSGFPNQVSVKICTFATDYGQNISN